MNSLSNVDHLNEDKVEAITKFREQINQRNNYYKISKKYTTNVLVDFQDDPESSIDDRVCSDQEQEDKNKREDDSSEDEDVVLPQGRNNFYGSDYKLNNNTHETNQDEDKMLCCIYQNKLVDDSYAILQKKGYMKVCKSMQSQIS